MKRICVFSGSNIGASPAYAQAAVSLGKALVERGIGLVYGGASLGLMYQVASTVQKGGGEVIGVIPQTLVDAEIANNDLDDLRIVGSMHERKALMSDLSDAFIALPGGVGTLEETAEIWTWNQLGIISKPCGLLNVAGYFDAFIQFLDHMQTERFMKPEHRAYLLSDDNVDGLLEQFKHYTPLKTGKWIS